MDSSPIKNLQTITKGRWQWKSNSDPWSKSEEPQWEFYTLPQNYLLEKAYYDQQKEVDLGDYIVSIKRMIQKKKGAIVSQRSIRRIDWTNNIQEIDRSERFFETELPKTINKIFGSLEDFVDFFTRRNPEILDFNKKFKELEESNNLDGLNHQITPKLVECLEEELVKRILEQFKNQPMSLFKKKMLVRNEELIGLFKKKEFSSLEEFYGQILRAYTMDTDLYGNLNKYLREESWIDIDKLLPYIFCFCKAFFNSKRSPYLNERKTMQEIEEHCQEKTSIFLYRGTALHESALESYNIQKVDHFSWYSVTSTSLCEKMAEDFMYFNANIPKRKYPVMFIIELPMTEELIESDYLKWIDIQEYSAKPKEKEVVLAPGSVFELQEVSTDKNQITTIKLKLLNKVRSLAYKGLIMQGTLQREMMTEKEMKVMCLEGEELNETLKSISGNKLIEELEFCLCLFNNKSLGKMIETLSTLEKTKALKFISCSFKDQEEFFNERSQDFQISTVEISEISDFYKILGVKNNEGKLLLPVKELKLNLKNFRHIKDTQLNKVLFKELGNLTRLTTLSLDFDWCSQLTQQGIQSLAFDGLKNLTELTSLSLSFSNNQLQTDEEFNSLALLILKPLKELTSLTLSFNGGEQIHFKGSKQRRTRDGHFLCYLTDECHSTDDEDERYEEEEEEEESKNIRDGTLHFLVFQGFRFTQLESLTLNFSRKIFITDDGVNSISFMGLQRLTKLTSLALNFEGLNDITDDAVKSLTSYGFKNLTKLSSLALNFQGCWKITNEGIHVLASEGFKHLTQLTYLSLDFSGNFCITDEGIENLAAQGLKHLLQLVSLNLDLSATSKITENGVNILIQELKNLKQLTTINVRKPTPQNPQVFNGLGGRRLLQQHQTRPQTYSMKLICERFPNGQKQFQEGQSKSSVSVDHGLQSQRHPNSSKVSQESGSIAAQHLIKAKKYALPIYLQPKQEILDILHSSSQLSLDFSSDPMMTDERIKIFSSQELKKRTQLVTLNLKFRDSQKITNDGVSILASEGLKYLTCLVCLRLDFSENKQISDEGVNSLTSQLIKYLPQLEYLVLNFEKCDNVTEFTICNIIRVLRYFGFSIQKGSNEDVLNEGSDEDVSSEESDEDVPQLLTRRVSMRFPKLE